MRYEKWTTEELDFLKNYYQTTEAKTIAAKLGRTTQSVFIMSHKLGLKSSTRIIRENKKKELIQLIVDGCDNVAELSRKSGMCKSACRNTLYLYVHNNGERIRLAKEHAKPYILSEEELFDSIDPIYTLEPRDGWEYEQLQKDTPKGFECPKLHTKQLNTYKL